jgi:5'-3' exonuclease
MPTPVLVVDSNYLAWRAAYSTGKLSHQGTGTGIIYGFLRDMLKLQRQFATTRIAFAFDMKGSTEREKIYPHYKKKRKEKEDNLTLDEIILYARVRKQITILRDEILPYIGFRNIFYQSGFEGDDVVASIVNNLGIQDAAVIVSGDKDLYQLINNKVVVWHPKADQQVKAITHQRFVELYGITPDRWVQVKALAGCSTDCVPGINGVAEKTAIQFLKGEMNSGKIKDRIEEWIETPQYLINLDLVRVPYPGTPDFILCHDRFDHNRFDKLIRRYGMYTLKEMVHI